MLLTIPGNHNVAMGCDADWAPGCDKATRATRRACTARYASGRRLPGTRSPRAARGTRPLVPGALRGANISYTLTETTPVTFFYNRATHRVWNTATDQMVTLPGSFQKALGCWMVEARMPGALMEPVGNGTYTYSYRGFA